MINNRSIDLQWNPVTKEFIDPDIDVTGIHVPGTLYQITFLYHCDGIF